MRKAANTAGRAIRKAMFVVVATVMSVGGLALLAGGGYMLMAQSAGQETPTTLTQVLAEEATAPVVIKIAADSGSGTATAAAATKAAAESSAETPTTSAVTQVAADSDSGAATAVAGATMQPQATATLLLTATAGSQTPVGTVTATSTRVSRATATATPTSNSGELPDAGFGDFLQPIAGFGLAGIALIAHAIRRRH
ncbi:MAG: hypothetical protein ACUVWR_04255 [Anaerolineae bacterium]